MYDTGLTAGHTETLFIWGIEHCITNEVVSGGGTLEWEYDTRLDKLLHKENKSLADYIREGKLRVPEFLIHKLV